MRRNIGNLQKQMNEMERRMIDRKQKLHLPSVILVKNIVILNDLVTAPGRDRSLLSCKAESTAFITQKSSPIQDTALKVMGQAEYEQDVARVSKLKEQSVPSALKYSLPDFKKNLEKKQKEYEKSVRAEAKEMTEAEKRKAAYEKSSM